MWEVSCSSIYSVNNRHTYNMYMYLDHIHQVLTSSPGSPGMLSWWKVWSVSWSGTVSSPYSVYGPVWEAPFCLRSHTSSGNSKSAILQPLVSFPNDSGDYSACVLETCLFVAWPVSLCTEDPVVMIPCSRGPWMQSGPRDYWMVADFTARWANPAYLQWWDNILRARAVIPLYFTCFTWLHVL